MQVQPVRKPLGTSEKSENTSRERSNTATTCAKSSTSGTSYVPEPGDVVEFEYDKETCRGVVYANGGDMNVAFSYKGGCYGCLAITALALRKLDTVSFPVEDVTAISIESKVKAYFAEQDKPQATQFKVGDLVEIGETLRWHSFETDSVVRVVSVNGSEIELEAKDKDYTQNLGSCDLRPLSGSYAERQAKWVKFHGLKAGDEVRVTREAKDKEDGWGTCWVSEMTEVIGNSLKVRKVYSDEAGISVDIGDGDYCCFPYFCLEPVK